MLSQQNVGNVGILTKYRESPKAKRSKRGERLGMEDSGWAGGGNGWNGRWVELLSCRKVNYKVVDFLLRFS